MREHKESVAKYRSAELFRVKAGSERAFYRLLWNGRLVAEDRQFKYLNQIMYQIG